MPIKLKCACGQVLSVPDNLAGKSGKCPKCQKAIQIPIPAASQPSQQATGQSKPTPAAAAQTKVVAQAKVPSKPTAQPVKAAAAPVAAAPQPNKMESLFEEAGLKRKTGPVCPKCGADIRPGTVICFEVAD